MKRQGICMICACTEDAACDGGCWTNPKRTLCSDCARLSKVDQLRTREAAMAKLTQQVERLRDDAQAEMSQRLVQLRAELKAELTKRFRCEFEMLKKRLDVLKPEPGKRRPQRTKPSQHPRYPKEARK